LLGREARVVGMTGGRRIAERVVLHPNPPPSLEEGIRTGFGLQELHREVRPYARRDVCSRFGMSELAAWDSFYVIVGSAAGALIGLQFVVMTLVAARPSLRAAEAGAAFATPTIIHFGTALLLSALLRVPWQSIIPAAACCGLIGLCGVAYAIVVARRMRRQTVYQPEFEDWLFHALLPLAAYATLAISSFASASRTREALFGVGAAALLLLFIGIHNAWDSTSYHVFSYKRDTTE
jgi:hypothetical protein